MANNKTNSAEVLKYFNDIKQARKGTMMKSYGNSMKTGGTNCKPGGKCKKVFKKVGKFVKDNKGSIASALGAAAASALTFRHAKKNPGSMGGFGDFLRGIGKN